MTGVAAPLAELALAALRRVRIVTVDGASMAPTLGDGDRVLVRRVPATALRRGDVVLLRHPAPPRRGPRWIVKRVLALPGDPAPVAAVPALRGLGARVPAGMLVVLGDNPQASVDSREFGYAPLARLFGVVVRRL